MTHGPTPDPSKVMVNGAALAFMTALIAEVRTDLRATEERLGKQITGVFAMHAEEHDEDRVDELEWRKRTRDRLTDLEKAELADDTAAALRAERRAGRRDVIAVPIGFVERHHRALLLVIPGIAYVVGQLVGRLPTP